MPRLVRFSPPVIKRKPARENSLPLAVLEFESPSAAIIATPVPGLSRATNFLVFLLVVSVLAASAVIRVDKVVSAKGKLIADAPNIVMQPFDQSIVESVDVKKGSIVRKGQTLARLNPTFTAADHTAIKDQVDLLSAKAARLQAEAAGKGYSPERSNPHAALQASILNRRSSEYGFSLQAFDKGIDQLTTQIAGDNAQAVFFRERLGIATDIADMRESLLAKQLASKSSALLAADTRLSVEASLTRAESDAAQGSRRLGAQQAERKTFVERWYGQISQELADTRGKLVEAQQAYAKISLHNELVVLTAPRDAVVLSVANISVGSVVTSAEPLIQLVPIDTPLSVEADISGIESGYVSPGNEVRIKFDTLPFLRYGSARGIVRSMSADSFSPETTVREGGSILPNRPSTLYYRAEISLEELELHNTPEGFRPMPGMPITADVKVGTRTVLSYFIDRILPVVYDGLREP